MDTGICTNLPSHCSKAASGEPLPMPTADAKCPECGSPLRPARGRGPGGGPLRAGPLVAGAVLLALLIAGGLLFALINHPARERIGGDGRVMGDQAYDLRLAGSNTIGSELGPELVKAWLTSKGATDLSETTRSKDGKPIPERVITARLDGRDLRIEVRAHGSATAFTGLADGSADIGMASRAIKPEEVASLASLGQMRAPTNEHVLGLDGVAVILPTSNRVEKLTIADLRRLFSGEASSWREFGVEDQPVHVYARDDKSGTWDTFKELVLKTTPLAPGAQRLEDSAELEQAVARDPGAIGFVGLPYVKSTRAVPISDGDAPALEPTTFTVKTENYPLSRRLYLYTATSPSNPMVKDFVAFALSSRGQSVVRASHFIGLDFVEPTLPAPAIATRDCRLSSRWPGDPDAYCRLQQTAEQLGTSFRFQTGSSQLDTRAVQDLRNVLDRMERTPDKRIVLAGFADSSGGYAANCALSRSRAETVAAALATLGLHAQTLGFCQELPVRDNSTPEGREENRRVEIFVQ